MKQIYLASRYSRRVELCEYREHLGSIGYLVQARWLNGGHQLDNAGTPISDNGEALVEAGFCERADTLRAKFANDDWEDVCSAEIQINFTEPPRSSANRGGRHVELGIALARQQRVIVVGHRENIFHWLPQVEFYQDWPHALEALSSKKKADSHTMHACMVCPVEVRDLMATSSNLVGAIERRDEACRIASKLNDLKISLERLRPISRAHFEAVDALSGNVK